MTTIYNLSFMRPDNILEEYTPPNFPPYSVGQTILLDHRDNEESKNIEKFIIEEIIHEIKKPEYSPDKAVEYTMMVYLRNCD